MLGGRGYRQQCQDGMWREGYKGIEEDGKNTNNGMEQDTRLSEIDYDKAAPKMSKIEN
jgi:hypothetical protein